MCHAHGLHMTLVASTQILGAEARSRVPEEYIVQQPSSANPPTLFLVLAQMADQIAAAAANPDASAAQALQDQEQFLKAGKLRAAGLAPADFASIKWFVDAPVDCCFLELIVTAVDS